MWETEENFEFKKVSRAPEHLILLDRKYYVIQYLLNRYIWWLAIYIHNFGLFLAENLAVLCRSGAFSMYRTDEWKSAQVPSCTDNHSSRWMRATCCFGINSLGRQRECIDLFAGDSPSLHRVVHGRVYIIHALHRAVGATKRYIFKRYLGFRLTGWYDIMRRYLKHSFGNRWVDVVREMRVAGVGVVVAILPFNRSQSTKNLSTKSHIVQ